jgi:hypothetical protein
MRMRMRIKGLIREWKADIVYLQQTKLEFINRKLVTSLWGCAHLDWCLLGSRGTFEGILLM